MDFANTVEYRCSWLPSRETVSRINQRTGDIVCKVSQTTGQLTWCVDVPFKNFLSRHNLNYKDSVMIGKILKESGVQSESEIDSTLKSYISEQGKNLLHMTCDQCNIDLAKYCLEIGIDIITSCDDSGYNCLHFIWCK